MTAPFAVVVNDDPTQLDVLSGLVRKAGLEPRAFGGAEAALADMSAWAGTADGDPGALPALVVTDLYMPGIDGWRFCRLLRSPEYAVFNQVPILLVSATYAGEQADRIAADLGAEAFLPSPVDGKRFVEQLRAIVKGRQVRKRLRALVVEDDESLAGILKSALAASGYQADTALTARAADDAFEKTAYDVAVLDHHLPDGTGDALLDVFHAERPDCVCIMLTTDPGPELALDWMKRGAAAYLRKPFLPDYLIELCERARRERALLRVQDLLEVRTRELRESEEKHRILLEEASDPISSYTPEGRYTYVNPAFAEGVGKLVEHIIGKSIWDVFPKEEAYQRFASLSQVFRTGEESVIEERVPRADGDRFYMTAITPIKDAAGEVLSAVCSSRDITGRKRAEEALRKSESLYQALVETSPDAIAVSDHDGIITLMNQQLAKLHGYEDKQELMGKCAFELFAPEERQRAADNMGRGMEAGTGETRKFECILQRRDGTRFWGELYGTLMLSPDDKSPFMLTIVRDITERKRAESQREAALEALRESEEKYRGIFDESIAAVYVFDDKKNFINANQAGLDLLGYSREELLHMSIPAVDADPIVVLPAHQKLLSGGRLINYEHRLRRKDGTAVTVLNNSKPLTDVHGNVVGMLSTLIDITERKRAEEELRESEARYRRITEGLTDYQYSVRVEDGRAVETRQGPACARVTGYTAEEDAADPDLWFRIVTPEDRDRVREHSRLTLAGEDVPPIEHRIVRKDGEVRWVSDTTIPHKDASGRLLSYDGVITDITERKRAEEELDLKDRAMATSFNAIVIADINGLVTYANDAFLRMWGYTAQEAHGLDVLGLPFSRDEALQVVRDIMEKGFCLGESVAKRKDGSPFRIQFSASLVTDSAGAPIAMLGSFLDITARKRAEEENAGLETQLQQAQKMESVGRLAGGVAHDFNNMLGVILGHAELALGQVDPAQPLHADLAEIRKAAERSADLTRQLLAFARKQTVAPKVLDLNETVAGMLKMLRRLIGENIDLDWQPEAGLWPVRVDPSQIDQILANLSVNARDAIADVGEVTIETANVAIDADYCAAHAGFVPGEYVRLAVSDDGCGMDKETLAHVFEPFFTTKDVGTGTGLGLATVYGIVKQNNGFISAYSEPGQGTTFTIYLPRHAGKVEQTRTEGAAGPPVRGQETILLVEDEQAILEMTTEMLELQGYVVLAAGTPGRAIRLAREHHGEIHLLMTDVVMPEMNGRDLARNLLSLYPHLKRVFTSGYTANVIAHRGVLDEGVHFLQKPFSMKGLAAKVREALDSD